MLPQTRPWCNGSIAVSKTVCLGSNPSGRAKLKLKTMGYSYKYDTHYDDETGAWLEKIGFCSEEDNCDYCNAYNADGRPATAFDAPKDALED